jgi:hypothetical protein
MASEQRLGKTVALSSAPSREVHAYRGVTRDQAIEDKEKHRGNEMSNLIQRKGEEFPWLK